MIYPFLSLQAVGIVVGLVLLVAHGFALAAPAPTKSFLRAFPRSRVWAGILLTIAAVWAFWLVRTMDLGEFARLRRFLVIGVPVGAVLTWFFVDEFLAVRALGILALLAAEPLLEAAFLRPEISRLVLVCLAYAWVFAGLFLVGMPYFLRDIVAWLLASAKRYQLAAVGGAAYGLLLLVCALTW
jgi:hypothetical protein